jgi:hypothetical protein
MKEVSLPHHCHYYESFRVVGATNTASSFESNKPRSTLVKSLVWVTTVASTVVVVMVGFLGDQRHHHHEPNLSSQSMMQLWDPRRGLQGDESLLCTPECCIENYGDTLPCQEEEESTADNPFGNTPLWFQIALMVFLIIMSAFFSGLTLGLMGLDKTGLEIVMEGDDVRYREYAKRIYPLRKRGNLLLCTLLLGNVCVNSLLSILTADKFGGTIGLLSSTYV